MSILGRLFPKIPTHKIKGGYILVLFGIMLILAVIVKTYQSVQDSRFERIVPELSGALHFSTTSEAEAFLHRPLPAFPDGEGVSFAETVVYTEGLEGYPPDTTITTFQKDGHRLFEVLELPPNSSMPFISSGAKTRSVYITDETDGIFVPFTEKRIICHDVKEPSFTACTLTNRVVFLLGMSWYSIAIDGDQASEGELLTYARKIASQTR